MKEIKKYIENINEKEKINVLVKKLNSTEDLISHNAENVFVSASLIKLPIMLALLDKIKDHYLYLFCTIEVQPEEILDDNEVFEKGKYNYPMKDLVNWMITVSDNTSTNMLIKYLGFEYINQYIQKIGLKDTKLERYMNDWQAISDGKNNYTSLEDMYTCFKLLVNKEILTEELCNFALNILYSQKINNQIPKYITDVKFAHKTGGLDYLNSDVGIFEKDNELYFIGISIYNTPEAEGDRESVAVLSKLIYDYINKK